MIDEKLNEIIENLKPTLKEINIRIVEFNHTLISKDEHVIKVVIDKVKRSNPKEGITHGDCINVSKMLEEELNINFNNNLFDYSLEVSSFGLSRPLTTIEDYEAFIGSEVEIKLKQKLNGFLKYTGILKELIYNDSKLTSIIISTTEINDKDVKQYIDSKKNLKLPFDITTLSHLEIPVSIILKTLIKVRI